MRNFLFISIGSALLIGILLAASPSVAGERTIALRAVSGLQYDIVRFAVRPGETINLTLINTDEMAHNWLLTEPGQREVIVQLAMQMGNAGPERGYVPESEQILASIPVLNPDERRSIRFTAPATPGAYPYVCTYPGHGFIMYGVMYVTPTGEMPPRATDENIPEKRRSDQVALTGSGHPWPVRLPMVYRTFLPDCGPAGIAVGMDNGVSYAWDAGSCRLRYSWRGGLLNMADNWAGKGIELAELAGEVYYRTAADFPLRIGEQGRIPVAKFRGYSLSDGYPTLRYTLDGVAVAERILPAGTDGLRQEFAIENAPEDIWLLLPASDSIDYELPAGTRAAAFQRLTPAEAASFALTIRPTKELSR